MRSIVAAALICFTAAPAWAAALSLQEMIEIHNDLDKDCRGGGGDKVEVDPCETREKVSKAIKKMGYCMAYPQYTWHRC